MAVLPVPMAQMGSYAITTRDMPSAAMSANPWRICSLQHAEGGVAFTLIKRLTDAQNGIKLSVQRRPAAFCSPSHRSRQSIDAAPNAR